MAVTGDAGVRHANRQHKGGGVRIVVICAALLAVLIGLFAWGASRRDDDSATWGELLSRVSSPSGDFVVAVYGFDAMVDRGWNVVLERADGTAGEWVWLSVESPPASEIRWIDDTQFEVVALGDSYPVSFDPETLRPSDRYCLSTGYCYRDPFTQYTKTGP